MVLRVSIEFKKEYVSFCYISWIITSSEKSTWGVLYQCNTHKKTNKTKKQTKTTTKQKTENKTKKKRVLELQVKLHISKVMLLLIKKKELSIPDNKQIIMGYHSAILMVFIPSW